MKFSYKFINPNPIDDTADFILKMLIDSNRTKVEQAIDVHAGNTLPAEIAG